MGNIEAWLIASISGEITDISLWLKLRPENVRALENTPGGNTGNQNLQRTNLLKTIQFNAEYKHGLTIPNSHILIPKYN